MVIAVICYWNNFTLVLDVKLLIFANKQDLPNAMTTAEAIKALGLEAMRDREWHVQPTNAVTGEGLIEGLEWLHSVVIK
ncbi:hypothetical protein OSTOST_20129 [Ostertagia ostertagi]